MIRSRYGRQRETELAALTDPALREAGRTAGVELITYPGFTP